MDDLIAFQRDLLLVIAGLDEPAGVDVNEELERYYDAEIHRGQLYPCLDTLVEKGFVAKTQRDHQTNNYELTDRGKHAIEVHLNWKLTSVPDELKAELTDIVPESHSG